MRGNAKTIRPVAGELLSMSWNVQNAKKGGTILRPARTGKPRARPVAAAERWSCINGRPVLATLWHST